MSTPESEFYNWFSKSREQAISKKTGRHTARGLRTGKKSGFKSEMAGAEKRVHSDMDNQEYLKGYREIRSSLTGDVYKMPKHDYQQLVDHFNEHVSKISQAYADGNQVARNIRTPADLIDFAFEKDTQKKNLETQECAEGHIKRVSYNPLYMLLKVSFRKRGDEVVFFDLPPNVAATLLIHARDGNMGTSPSDGRTRHMVGIEFWNLVRVRGTQHDTRYPFQYTIDNRTGSWGGTGKNGNPIYEADYGRRPGSGATGKGTNKYAYVNNEGVIDMGEDPYDMRRKNISDEERSAYPVKERRYEWDEYTRMYNKANRDRVHDMSTENLEDWDIDDMAEYFDNDGKLHSLYNNHFAKTQGSLRKNLELAKKIYESGQDTVYKDDKGEYSASPGSGKRPVSTEAAVIELLYKTNFDFPEHREDY